MVRRLFTLASALSLLLCLATAAMWVWNCPSAGEVSLRHGVYSNGQYEVGALAGRVILRVLPYPRSFVLTTVVDGKHVPVSGPVPVMGESALAGQSSPESGVPGVGWSETFFVIPMSFGPPVREVAERTVVVSLWLPLALFALLPGMWLLIRGHWRRHPAGHCRRCGYLLTGNVSGTCPECGAPVVAEARV